MNKRGMKVNFVWTSSGERIPVVLILGCTFKLHPAETLASEVFKRLEIHNTFGKNIFILFHMLRRILNLYNAEGPSSASTYDFG